LFLARDLRSELESRIGEALSAIRVMSPDLILNTPMPDLVQAVVDDFTEDDIAIYEDRMEQLPVTECQVDVTGNPMFFNPRGGRMLVPGSCIKVTLPYSGHPALFQARPSQFFLGEGPHGLITHDRAEILMKYEAVTPTPEQIQSWLDQELHLLRRSIEYVNTDLAGFRQRLLAECQQAIAARKERLELDRGLNGTLGLPVRRFDAPAQPVPVARKRLNVKKLEDRPSGPYKDEYALDQAVYEGIIDIIQNMGLAIERNPTTFAKLGEEELRDHILLQLNGTFEGAAGGELFNGAGKTDILVRHENRNVFIAECKIWHGQEKFKEAIDQLLSYLVWRDSKAALIPFIRQVGVSDIIEKADATIREHCCFKRLGAPSGDPSARRNYVLHQKDDENREVRVALLPVAIRTA
jgi:hypothetical protein